MEFEAENLDRSESFNRTIDRLAMHFIYGDVTDEPSISGSGLTHLEEVVAEVFSIAETSKFENFLLLTIIKREVIGTAIALRGGSRVKGRIGIEF